jgi:conserved oligomeric Golgi complex subunit 1
VIVRDVRQKLKTVIDVVVRTMGVSRRIFLGQTDENSPLMYDVLHHIQSEDVSAAKSLPAEVRLTSHTLLTSLPSSNHFLLLPASIKSYKPYLESSFLLAGAQNMEFKTKLEDWFKKALQTIRASMELWLAELDTIRELWGVRRWCKRLLNSAIGLEAGEISQFSDALDSVCRHFAVKIWKTALHSSEMAFREQLAAAIKNIELEFDTCSSGTCWENEDRTWLGVES